MGEYRVSTAAYAKLLLHAGGHAERACYGLLLGEVDASSGLLRVSDAAPLFHHEAPLAPLTEVACAMADAWARQRGQQVVGVYVAPADGGSSSGSLGAFAAKLADKVASLCPRACVLLVDGLQLADASKPGVQLLLKDVKRGWVRVDHHLRLDEDAVAVAARGLASGAAAELADVEDHLDDVKKDWRNPHVARLLQLQV